MPSQASRTVVTPMILSVLVAGVLSLALAGAVLADPPSEDEKKVFDDIAARFDGHKANADVSINEVLASFTTEQVIPVACDQVDGAVVDRCEISVRTELEAFNEADVARLVGEQRPAAYFWRCRLVEENDEGARIKAITCNNGVMFRESYLKTIEEMPVEKGGELGRLDNERLFYHEMLHGQLLIDAMQDDAAWRASCCRCFPDTGGKTDIGPSDLGHRRIPGLDVEYAQQTGAGAGITVVIRKIVHSSDGKTNPVVVPVAKLSDFDKKILPFAVPIENIEPAPEPEDFFVEGDDVKVEVTLVDVYKPARLMVYIDPPGLGLIELVEILPQSTLEIPALGLLGFAALAVLLTALSLHRLHRARITRS